MFNTIRWFIRIFGTLFVFTAAGISREVLPQTFAVGMVRGFLLVTLIFWLWSYTAKKVK